MQVDLYVQIIIRMKITGFIKNAAFYMFQRFHLMVPDVYLHSDQRLRSVNRNYPLLKLADGLHPWRDRR